MSDSDLVCCRETVVNIHMGDAQTSIGCQSFLSSSLLCADQFSEVIDWNVLGKVFWEQIPFLLSTKSVLTTKTYFRQTKVVFSEIC